MAEPANVSGLRNLIVAVPGLKGDMDSWDRLEEAFRERNRVPGRARWLKIDHGLRRFSRKPIEPSVREIDAQIHEAWVVAGGYDEVTLVGHSIGGLLVRRAWLDCVDPLQGENHTGNPWGMKVARFVLFAAVSRGVDTEQLPFGIRLLTRALEALPGTFMVEHAFCGSKFVTDLRLDWLRFFGRTEADLPRPAVVQFLGRGDKLVRREDSIDLIAFPDCKLTDVPNATHSDVHRVDHLANPDARLTMFELGFAVEPTGNAPEVVPSNDQRILMLVHGIRASRTDDWVGDAETLVAQRWPDVEVHKPTYGYLSAIRFALPSVRRRYGRFFRDFYTQVVTCNRNAEVNVLCHSNGTYALGRSLLEFRSIRLNKVALAGSVLPSDFKWRDLVNRRQVQDLRSDAGSGDVPVAILCRALRSLGMKDLGTGGFEGFKDIKHDVRYHRGGHGAMLQKDNLASILEFLLEGRPPTPSGLVRADGMGRLSRLTAYLTWAVLALIASALVSLALSGAWPAVLAGLGLALVAVLILDII